MSLFNITVKVDTSDTVPLRVYEMAEHKLRRSQLANGKLAIELEKAQFNITSLLRELSASGLIRDEGFFSHLQSKYELIKSTNHA